MQLAIDVELHAAVLPMAVRSAAMRRIATTVTGEWRERFFVLCGGELNYWRSAADYDSGKPPELESSLRVHEYEVLVDTDSPKWAFTIAPINREDGERTYYLRAPSEEARLVWAKKLVTNALLLANADD